MHSKGGEQEKSYSQLHAGLLSYIENQWGIVQTTEWIRELVLCIEQVCVEGILAV